jgi:transcriptional regulator with XRE-family HTH domain
MSQMLGDIIKQARQTHHLTLRRLADQVSKEDGTSISPQYLFDIEVHHRVPSPYVLRELARVLELDGDTLLTLAGAADVVLRDYLQTYPEAGGDVIKLFRAAQQQAFVDWERLRRIIEQGAKPSR